MAARPQRCLQHNIPRCISRLFTRTSDLERQEILGRLLSSLARTSVAQYEALNRLYASVSVAHVSVNEGGQAIVGSVTHNEESATQSTAAPQPLLTEADAVPMPMIEECEERVPVPVSHTEEIEGLRRQ